MQQWDNPYQRLFKRECELGVRLGKFLRPRTGLGCEDNPRTTRCGLRLNLRLNLPQDSHSRVYSSTSTITITYHYLTWFRFALAIVYILAARNPGVTTLGANAKCKAW